MGRCWGSGETVGHGEALKGIWGHWEDTGAQRRTLDHHEDTWMENIGVLGGCWGMGRRWGTGEVLGCGEMLRHGGSGEILGSETTGCGEILGREILGHEVDLGRWGRSGVVGRYWGARRCWEEDIKAPGGCGGTGGHQGGGGKRLGHGEVVGWRKMMGGGYGGHWEDTEADKGHKPSLPHPEELPSLPVTPSDPGAR